MKLSTGLMASVTDSYHKMIANIQQADCKSLFDAMQQAKRILVYGSGYAQARVASEFKRIFLPHQNNIFNIHGYDMVKPLARLATDEDLVVVISLSGESRAVVELAQNLRIRQIPTVSITRMRNNTLSSMCWENLYIHSIPVPTDYLLDYEISTPYFILIELLYLKYQVYLNSLSEKQDGTLLPIKMKDNTFNHHKQDKINSTKSKNMTAEEEKAWS